MSKMRHFINKFLRIVNYNLRFGDLKLRDLAKLQFFKMTKSNLKN